MYIVTQIYLDHIPPSWKYWVCTQERGTAHELRPSLLDTVPVEHTLTSTGIGQLGKYLRKVKVSKSQTW